MATIARVECRKLLVLQLYRRHLNSPKLRVSSQKGYASLAASWTYNVARANDITQLLLAEEEMCVYYAAQERWGRLQAIREHTLTARLLTLTTHEVCEYISAWRRERNLSSLATSLNAIDKFYGWLERERLIKTNTFRTVRQRLELTVSGFDSSLEKAKEILA
jgi:hypothetical protein